MGWTYLFEFINSFYNSRTKIVGSCKLVGKYRRTTSKMLDWVWWSRVMCRSQYDPFKTHCSDWKDSDHFGLVNNESSSSCYAINTNRCGNLLSIFLLRCGTRPYEWGTQCNTDRCGNLLSFFFCLDVAQDHMNGAPNATRIDVGHGNLSMAVFILIYRSHPYRWVAVVSRSNYLILGVKP